MTFQLGSALLDACVLAVLETQDTYGYVLTQKVKAVISVSESTLYPVLRRLQKDHFLATYDQPFQGRNRRYYSITPYGKVRLEEFRGEWSDYREKVDKMLLGGMRDEQG